MSRGAWWRCVLCLLLPVWPVFAAAATPPPPAFEPCAVCHSTDGSNGVGPSLKGILGRRAGSFPGFRYSRGMRAASFSWDASLLDRYLTDPQGLVPGNVMPFSGIADPAARADLISWLATLN